MLQSFRHEPLSVQSGQTRKAYRAFQAALLILGLLSRDGLGWPFPATEARVSAFRSYGSRKGQDGPE
jgi:hypothetical protein